MVSINPHMIFGLKFEEKQTRFVENITDNSLVSPYCSSFSYIPSYVYTHVSLLQILLKIRAWPGSRVAEICTCKQGVSMETCMHIYMHANFHWGGGGGGGVCGTLIFCYKISRVA